MTDDKMLKVIGGSISGTVLNAISRLINTFLELGRSIGTSLRRIRSNNKCQ